MNQTSTGWPDRYRPQTLEEMALAPKHRRLFQLYLKNGLARHLILYGPPGFGKTTVAKIIERELYLENDQSGSLPLKKTWWLNAAEAGNVEKIRTHVVNFMRTGGRGKLLVFEEASGLTGAALEALRDPLEKFADYTKVIFLTNHIDKLDDEAIRSRCNKIYMDRPPYQESARVLQRIMEAEGVQQDPAEVQAFARAQFEEGEAQDLRSLLANAQQHVSLEGRLPVPAEPERYAGAWEEDWDSAYPTIDETDGAKLLNDLKDQFEEYVSLPRGGVEALVLWTVFAWAHEAFTVSPILTLASPTMRAGKSTVFEILAQVLPPDRTFVASSITPAVIYRTAGPVTEGQYRPALTPTPPKLCLLMDEADAWIKDLGYRQIFASGHTRRGAVVKRMMGGSVEDYSSWYPKALALIEGPRSSLAEPLRDRSITIPMQRMRRAEQKKKWPKHKLVPESAALRQELLTWVRARFDELRELNGAEELLAAEELNDRARDNWHPLMVIARLAGGGWEERARKASLELSKRARETELVVELLRDIQEVFDDLDAEKVHSRVLIERLRAMEAAPWKERGLDPRRLSNMLRPLGIGPGQVHTNSGLARKPKNSQGYTRRSFEDAFSRYI